MTASHWKRFCGAALVSAWSAAALAQTAPVPKPRPPDRLPEAGSIVEPEDQLPAIEGEVPEGGSEAFLPAVNPLPETAAEAVAAIATELQTVQLSALITEEGEAIPEGLVWRIFETETDTSGELALAAKSEDAIANLKLAPGQYVIHVAYGRAQASETLVVESGDNKKAIVLDAGALRLNAAVTGDISIPINQLRFDIYSGAAENDQTLVAEAVAANDIVTLNAGTYHVVSRFGSVNATVRADLRVEPGQLTDATLYHRAAQVSFKLVTEAGGEAIADIEWTVKSAAGDTLLSEIGAFPATVLAEGDYLVLAKHGENVYNREFEVLPGPSREVEVLTTVY